MLVLPRAPHRSRGRPQPPPWHLRLKVVPPLLVLVRLCRPCSLQSSSRCCGNAELSACPARRNFADRLRHLWAGYKLILAFTLTPLQPSGLLWECSPFSSWQFCLT